MNPLDEVKKLAAKAVKRNAGRALDDEAARYQLAQEKHRQKLRELFAEIDGQTSLITLKGIKKHIKKSDDPTTLTVGLPYQTKKLIKSYQIDKPYDYSRLEWSSSWGEFKWEKEPIPSTFLDELKKRRDEGFYYVYRDGGRQTDSGDGGTMFLDGSPYLEFSLK